MASDIVRKPSCNDNDTLALVAIFATIVKQIQKQQWHRSRRSGHWPAGMPGRQAVTPVSQSQGFIPVWSLAVVAHGKYHFIARNSPCVRTVNIIVV